MSACRSARYRNNFNRACRTCRRGSSQGSRCRCRGKQALGRIRRSSLMTVEMTLKTKLGGADTTTQWTSGSFWQLAGSTVSTRTAFFSSCSDATTSAFKSSRHRLIHVSRSLIGTSELQFALSYFAIVKAVNGVLCISDLISTHKTFTSFLSRSAFSVNSIYSTSMQLSRNKGQILRE